MMMAKAKVTANSNSKCTLNPTEEQIHFAIMDWVRLHKLDRVVVHVPNQGIRNGAYNAKLKRMGLLKGFPDLFIRVPRKGYHGAFMELKSAKGRLSKEQELFLKESAESNYFSIACWNVEDAIKTLRWYLFD